MPARPMRWWPRSSPWRGRPAVPLPASASCRRWSHRARATSSGRASYGPRSSRIRRAAGQAQRAQAMLNLYGAGEAK